jgi:hypothetical protein
VVDVADVDGERVSPTVEDAATDITTVEDAATVADTTTVDDAIPVSDTTTAVAAAVTAGAARLAARMSSSDSRETSKRGGELHSPLGSSHRTRVRTPPLRSRLRTMPLTWAT